MANPYRATVTIDGTKFQAMTASVKFTTEKDHAGVAKMGSLTSSIRIWADMHDDINIPFSTIRTLFNLANVVTRDKIKAVKIEYWKDDSQQDALCAFTFNGWVRRFETSNPIDFIPRPVVHTTESLLADGVPPDLNHMLVIDIEPALNQQNYVAVQMTN